MAAEDGGYRSGRRLLLFRAAAKPVPVFAGGITRRRARWATAAARRHIAESGHGANDPRASRREGRRGPAASRGIRGNGGRCTTRSSRLRRDLGRGHARLPAGDVCPSRRQHQCGSARRQLRDFLRSAHGHAADPSRGSDEPAGERLPLASPGHRRCQPSDQRPRIHGPANLVGAGLEPDGSGTPGRSVIRTELLPRRRWADAHPQ